MLDSMGCTDEVSYKKHIKETDDVTGGVHEVDFYDVIERDGVTYTVKIVLVTDINSD